MSVTSDDFLSSADLLRTGLNEIDWRNSVSRSFYFSVHEACNLAAEKNMPDLNANVRMGTHERISKILKSSPVQPLGTQIAYILEDMKKRRVISDYSLNANVSQKDAEIQFEAAKKIKALIDTY